MKSQNIANTNLKKKKVSWCLLHVARPTNNLLLYIYILMPSYERKKTMEPDNTFIMNSKGKYTPDVYKTKFDVM